MKYDVVVETAEAELVAAVQSCSTRLARTQTYQS